METQHIDVYQAYRNANNEQALAHIKCIFNHQDYKNFSIRTTSDAELVNDSSATSKCTQTGSHIPATH